MRGCGGDVAAGVAFVVIAAEYGGPEVLSIVEEPLWEPGPGEARIGVRARARRDSRWSKKELCMSPIPSVPRIPGSRCEELLK